MANKLREPFFLAWIKWHLYRRRSKKYYYGSTWAFRRYAQACPPGGLMIDCGANVGDAAALFLKKGFTVHAFEPDDRARACLVDRIGSYPNLIVHPEAVGGASRKASFYRTASKDLGQTLHSSLLQRTEVHDAASEVEVVDLADFIASLNRPVDILKIDVEGTEVEILERLLETGLYRQIGRIFVETHERFSPELTDRLAAIRKRIAEEKVSHVDLDWT